MPGAINDPDVTDQLQYVVQVSDRVWDPNYVGKLEEAMVHSTKVSVLAVLPRTQRDPIPSGWSEVRAAGRIGNFVRSARTAQKWDTSLDPQLTDSYRRGCPRLFVEAVVNATQCRPEQVRPRKKLLKHVKGRVFEIKRRCHLDPHDYGVLKARAAPVLTVGKMYRDVYFDTSEYTLMAQNCCSGRGIAFSN